MPRNYTEQDMRQALEAAESGTPPKQAAERYGIPRQTLLDRLRRKSSSMSAAMEQYQRIPREKEEQICQWVLSQASRGEPPSYVEIVQRARCVLRESGDSKPLGKNWINGFIRRYPAISGIKAQKTESHSFWESTDMDEENSKQAITTLRALLLKGLPQQLIGVRPRSEEEISTDDDCPSLIMACRDTSGPGMTILSTDHLRALREEFDMVTASWIKFVEALPNSTKHNFVPRRVLCDPGHSKVEWSMFENMTMSLTELALDCNSMLQPVFKKTLDIAGKVTLECKSNNEIEMEQLGPILGRSWFISPLAPTLKICSALFFYNQIKLLAIGLEKEDNMLPWIFVKTYVGPFPTTLWTRYICSLDGEAHMQFHARYITLEPTSIIRPRQVNDGDGFCIRRDPCRAGGSGVSLSEGRVSIAVKTTTGVRMAQYSAVTLADSRALQTAASGQIWDEKLVPPNCGRFTGIAVFQAMLYHTIQLCKEEHIKTAKEISERLAPADKETQKWIDLVLHVIGQTTEGIKNLVKDCKETMKIILGHAVDGQATCDNSVIETRWKSLIKTQQEIGEELSSIFLTLRESSNRPNVHS